MAAWRSMPDEMLKCIIEPSLPFAEFRKFMGQHVRLIFDLSVSFSSKVLLDYWSK